jgi:hypothetical protein
MMTSSPIQPFRVWLRRGALDRRLADGADPKTSPELARRARQLTSTRSRAALAASIRNLLEAAEKPRSGYSASIPVQRYAIRAERRLLLDLADDLESGADLKPRGVALVERLVIDGASPVYMDSPDGTLHESLTQARAALHLA